jgi:threonyl-tRNA synthetase
LTAPNQAVGALLNGAIVDMGTTVREGDFVTFKSFEDKEGKEIFWHSSAHVLAQAVLRLWPEALPTIGPPIENGFYYDFANLEFSEEKIPTLEDEIKKVLQEGFEPRRQEFTSKVDAKQKFHQNPYKKELIDSFDEGCISAYTQGEFTDLCRGPHLTSLKKIKAFKILKTSGAYWRGDSNNEMLTRIYGISFPDKKGLQDYLQLLEEAKKRDHKIVGPQLGLFSLQEEAPGIPFIHPRGLIVWNRLLEFIRCLQQVDYVEIKTPMLMSKELWERSGHWFHYKSNMYLSEIEGREFAIKPMNCPGCMLFYAFEQKSYRDLPLRIAEIGHVHRYEASGALSGLFRVRGFHQDDAHLFMLPDQIQEEILGVLDLANTIYKTFDLTYELILSTRPKKEATIGSDADWTMATEALRSALIKWGHPFQTDEGEGAFYGPKIDIRIRDALGRFWQCGTVQLDFALPERFDLTYVGSDGVKKRPIMLHRALFGSIERFLGVLIEHFAGKFPLWLSPYPIRVLTVADRHIDWAKRVEEECRAHGFKCDLDTTSQSMGKKVRQAQLLKTNYILTIGDQEVTNQTVSIRTRDNQLHGEMRLTDFFPRLDEETKTKSLVSFFSFQQKGATVQPSIHK